MLLKCGYICVQVSKFRALSKSRQIHNRESLGQTSGEYSMYWQNLGRSGNSEIPDQLGFSRHMKTRLNLFTNLCHHISTNGKAPPHSHINLQHPKILPFALTKG